MKSKIPTVIFLITVTYCGGIECTAITCRVKVGGVPRLFVRVELGLRCNHGGKFLRRLLLGDGDAGTA